MTTTETMKLYILNEVLYDYTDGMCVISAESKEHCKQLFMEEFGHPNDSDYLKERRQKEFDEASVKVIEGVNHPAGVVSYVYGGG